MAAEDAAHPPGAPEYGPRDLGATGALFWIALLPRLYVAIAWAREPVWDGHYYDFGARRLAAGLGYSDDVLIDGIARWHPWCHYPVGYSAFLAAVYRLFGDGPHVAPIANAFVGAALAAAVHRLARFGLSTWRARLAGLLVALTPGLVLYAALVMTEPLAALGIVVAAWLVARDPRPWRGALLGGIALGLSALVRPQSLLMAPAFAWLAHERGARLPFRGAAVTAAASLAVALAIVAPWTARNCRVMDGCALVSTNGGWNLAIGAFPRATGRFETLRASDGCDVVTGQVQQDRCWLALGLHWIGETPGRWLGLAPKKLAFTFDHESFPIGYLGEAEPDAWPEARRARWRSILTASHGALLTAAVLGFVARPQRGRKGAWIALGLGLATVAFALFAATGDDHPLWPLALAVPCLAALPLGLGHAPERRGVLVVAAWAVASVCLTHVIFFGEDRYHVVVTPLLALLAAAALRPPAAPSRAWRTPHGPKYRPSGAESPLESKGGARSDSGVRGPRGRGARLQR